MGNQVSTQILDLNKKTTYVNSKGEIERIEHSSLKYAFQGKRDQTSADIEKIIQQALKQSNDKAIMM